MQNESAIQLSPLLPQNLRAPLIIPDNGASENVSNANKASTLKNTSVFYNQTRALFFKNAGLQWSQKGTNVCQVKLVYALYISMYIHHRW